MNGIGIQQLESRAGNLYMSARAFNMGRFGTAFRLFFRAISDREFARRARETLLSARRGTAAGAPAAREAATDASGFRAAPSSDAAPAKSPAPMPAPLVSSSRSDALTLLAALQREGRLIDFLKENIAPYSDAQVGAAVRDVHRDSAAVLERMFALRPVREGEEGTDVQVPAGADAGAVRLVGNVTGQPPYHGKLRHAGWQATRMQLPAWTGSPSASQIVAPAEVEI